MTMIGKTCPIRARAFSLSWDKRARRAAMSPLRTECFDIFSPPPGASEVMTQVERLSSRDTKIALRSVRIAACSLGRGQRACMVAPEWVVQQPHSARERGATNRAHGILSRRGRTSANRQPHVVPHGPLHLLIDSTGLKLFGKGEWNDEKHGRARRSWRKLHLAVDAETGEIVASVLTSKEAGDAGQVPVLLEQAEGEIASVMADGAYDGEPVYHAIGTRQPQAAPTIVIPPRQSAVLSPRSDTDPSQRDGHI